MKYLIPFTLAASTLLLLVLPVAAADKPNTDTHKNATTVQNAWPAESLSGSIAMVQPDEKLRVVKDANGVPFDLRITPKTRIMAGNQKVTLDKLSQDQNQY